MPDPIMYSEDAYVLLESGQPEQFLTPDELLAHLSDILRDRQADLPPDVQRLPTPEAQAKHLIDTVCELDVGPETYLQWYVVRLEK